MESSLLNNRNAPRATYPNTRAVKIQGPPPKTQPVSILATNNEHTDTVVAIWDLAAPKIEHAIESAEIEEIVAPLLYNSLEENIDPNNEVKGLRRNIVDVKDYAPGGKYRAIAKLLMRYKGKPKSRSMGTGWLINQDIIVTAGHNAFSWPKSQDENQTPAEVVEVEAYIGYQGNKTLQADLRSGQVQYRRGVSIATTRQYISVIGQRQYDVAFFKVDRPFEKVVPFSYRNTPRSGHFNLGVVGYSGDTSDGGQQGARMYEMFLDTKFDLQKAQLGMLEYTIDTFGGNSGGPVLTIDAAGKMISIGVHTYGGQPNSATVIGKFGIPFNDYICAFALKDNAKRPAKPLQYMWDGLKFINILVDDSESLDARQLQPGNQPTQHGFGLRADGTNNAAHFTESFDQTESAPAPMDDTMCKAAVVDPVQSSQDYKTTLQCLTAESGEEGLREIMRGAGNLIGMIPKDILTSGANALAREFGLGPEIGNLVGAGAHMAIMAAAKKLAGSGTESLGDAEGADDASGEATHAVLAQAAFEAVQRLADADHRPELQLQQQLHNDIFREMQTALPNIVPFYKKAGSVLAPVIKDVTLRAALNQINPPQMAQKFKYSALASNRIESIEVSGETAELLAAFQTAGAESGEEGFFDDVFSVLKTALPIAANVAGAVGGPWGSIAGTGLNVLSEFLPESAEESDGADPFAQAGLLDVEGGAWQQAALAEAALRALMKQPIDKLQQSGSIAFMNMVIEKTASPVLASQPFVRNSVSVVIDAALRQSSFTSGRVRGHQRFVCSRCGFVDDANV